MTTAKWASVQERGRIYPILLQDLMKMGVCRCGVEMPSAVLFRHTLYTTFTYTQIA
jgi:hypothetical protein